MPTAISETDRLLTRDEVAEMLRLDFDACPLGTKPPEYPLYQAGPVRPL